MQRPAEFDLGQLRSSAELNRRRNPLGQPTTGQRRLFPFLPEVLASWARGCHAVELFHFPFDAVPGTPEIPHLQIGDRVKLSALGLERSPRMTRTGVIVGAIGSSFEVLMDGSKTPVRLHKTYLEKADT